MAAFTTKINPDDLAKVEGLGPRPTDRAIAEANELQDRANALAEQAERLRGEAIQLGRTAVDMSAQAEKIRREVKEDLFAAPCGAIFNHY